MTGQVILSTGETVTLPELLSWRILRTDGRSCDSFSVSFQYAAKWEPILKRAVRFRGEYQGETQFFGIVDEYQASYGQTGLLAELHGRGLGGLLLDNQVAGRELYWVRLQDIIRDYVSPYGISKVVYDRDYSLNSFVVEYGATAFEVLQGFCQWAGEVQPRFLGDGTLLISAQAGEQKILDHPETVLEAVWNSSRYGVYSQVAAKSLATGLEQVVSNEAFIALGGSAVGRMTIPRKNSCRTGRYTPERMLRESAIDARVLRLTLKGAFWAEPGDTVSLALSSLGLTGSFQTAETETTRDGDGTRCRLTLREVCEEG